MFDIWNFYAHLASNIQVNYHQDHMHQLDTGLAFQW